MGVVVGDNKGDMSFKVRTMLSSTDIRPGWLEKDKDLWSWRMAVAVRSRNMRIGSDSGSGWSVSMRSTAMPS